MAEENKAHIKDESNVAPLDGAGTLEVSYKNNMMRSVLFIDTHILKIGQGSGSIVKLPYVPPMLLTCNHVIPSKDVARGCSIYFDHDNHEKRGVEVLGKDLFDLDGEDSFVTDEALDFTIITMNPDKIPCEKREPFLLHQYQRLDEYRLKKNDNVYLVHYPRMDSSFVRRENSYIVQFLNGYLFGHKAETQGGSSGCPVLKECRNKWVLVGVHRGTMPDKSGNPRINFATHVEAVHHTMLGKPNPLGDPNWEAIKKEISNLGPNNDAGNKESAPNGSNNGQPTPPKKDFMDCMPSDNGLQGIVTVLPVWFNYTLPLGIPADYVSLYRFDLMGGVQAMKYWRDGKSGKEYPSTWRFLLKELDSLNPGDAAKLKKKVEENPRWTEWPDQK